jgi:deoxyribodipyrimidine photo-lyase
MQELRTDPQEREAIATYIQSEFPFLEDPGVLSPHVGGRSVGLARLEAFKIESYSKQRNFLNGEVTRLSPYISRGCLSVEEIRQWALRKARSNSVDKFVAELAWRAFFHLVYEEEGDRIFKDMERPKVPLDKHQRTMPEDIVAGATGLPSMDTFIAMMKGTGYLHNHARMYLAAYIVHFRKVHWRAGADWMYALLIDGDFASNHLSWQWVASTFSNKPYIFNRENLERYAGAVLPGDPRQGDPFDYSYEELSDRLFEGAYQPEERRSSGSFQSR